MSDEELPVSDLLAARRVAEASPDFWNDLEAQLVDESAPNANGRTNTVARIDETIAEVDTVTVVDLASRRARRWALALAATAAAVIAAVVGLSVVGDDEQPTITDDPAPTTTTTTTTPPVEDAVVDLSSLPVVDVSASVSRIDTDHSSAHLATDEHGAVLITSEELVRVDNETDTTTRTTWEGEPTDSYEDSIVADGALWFIGGDGSLNRVDLETGDTGVVTTVPLSGTNLSPAMASVDGAILVLYLDGVREGWFVDRIDTNTNDVLSSVRLADGAVVVAKPLAAGSGSLWLGDRGGSVTRVDTETGEVSASIWAPDDHRDFDLLASDDAVWVIYMHTVHRIDPATNAIVATIAAPGDYAFFSTRNAALLDDTLIIQTEEGLYWFDAESETPGAAINLDSPPGSQADLTVSGNTLWFRDGALVENDRSLLEGERLGRVPLDALLPPAES